ncbi:response regulator [Iodidimonas sp. SYSU 1G8]|uniref:response regulator n=1 Tax=Iodidimonas sp. SYSU 1G8 TaxID=3133967 RepID=UPI0031FEEB91
MSQTGKSSALRLLMLEDSAIDAELSCLHLARSSLDVTTTVARGKREFLDALAEGGFDIIVADYSLPDFDGLQALDVAREAAPGTPFIFLSGVIGEEFAAEAVKRGATDYVLKRNMARLPAAVERAVAEATERRERRAAEMALRQSMVGMRLAIDAARLGAWDYSPVDEKLHWDRRCKAIFGVPDDAAFTLETVYARCHPEDTDRILEGVRAALDPAGTGELSDEYRVVRDNGEEVWVAVRGQAFFEGGACIRLTGIMQDITDRKRSEHAMMARNQALEAKVLESTRERDRMWTLSQDLMTVFLQDGTMGLVNPAWHRVLGWTESELLGRHMLDMVHEDDAAGTGAAMQGLLEGAPCPGFDNRVRTRDGAYRWIRWTASPEGGMVYAVGRDITEELENAEKLRQTQKMEMIGQLTGGVAHDFNNLLTVIVGNLDMAAKAVVTLNTPPATERVRRLLENARRGTERATALTQRLLAFARRQPLDPKPIDSNQLVLGMSDLFNRTLGDHIAVSTELDQEIWLTHADGYQLENALLNLAVNARDAMPDGGRLVIQTRNCSLDDRDAAEQADIAPGHYVLIAVTDTGTGMDRETVAQVFEPFFTTKDIGHGSGLGLSQVYGFVKQSGGHVKIYSETGLGTTVKIYLPRMVEPRDDTGADNPTVRGPADGQTTILVVEDDEDVRVYSTELLRDLGYRVLEAVNGAAALAVLREHPEVRLLFTDIGLPGGMNGRELADAVRRLRPRLRILFTSGFATNAVAHSGRLDPGIQLLPKPFTYELLAARIAGVLGAPTSPARVLIVEDEVLVRMVAVDILSDIGFRVEEAGNAGEALSKMRAAGERFDAAIIDIGLPDMKGDRLAAELREIRPDLPVLIASGYDMEEIRARLDGDKGIAVVPKPYDGSDLRRELEKLGVMV